MWAILQHAAWEGPGLIAAELEARGIGFRVHRLDQGDRVPEAGSFDGLIVMGGPMGVYEADQFPYLRQEQTTLAAAASAGWPVLGVCLGAQLLAAALGAAVSRGAVFERGAGEVELTAAGRADTVMGGGGERTVPVVHWHQDTFPLPRGTTLLASTNLYPHQAFRWGRRAYGLQFHPEVNAELAAAWRAQGMELSAGEVERVEASGRKLVNRFLALSAGE